MEETIAEILKDLKITKEQLASFLQTTVENITQLEGRCCHAPMDPVARKLYALERVVDLLSVFVSGEDLQESEMLDVLQKSRICLDMENHEEEENQKYYTVSLLELINLDPLNSYWFPLTECAVNSFIGSKPDFKKEEMN